MAPPGPRSRPLRAFLLPGVFVGLLFYALWSRRPQPTDQIEGRNLTALTGPIMGTTFSVKVITAEPTTEAEDTALKADVLGTLTRINESMSTWREDSEVSRFNRHDSTAPFPLSADTLAVLRAAAQVSAASDGAFDVTIKPLVNLWKFGSDAEEWDDPPTNAEIALQLGQVGYTQLTLGRDSVQKAQPSLTIDLGAIAKGYAVDQVGLALEARGIGDYMVEVGGEVRVRGQNAESEDWRIGIERPDALRGTLEEVIALRDLSLATSGDYRNYYEDDNGQRISHTIDARTGRPITHTLASVSVLHTEAMMADAWATALNVLGPEEGLALAEAEGLAVMMLVREGPGQFTQRTAGTFDTHRVNP